MTELLAYHGQWSYIAIRHPLSLALAMKSIDNKSCYHSVWWQLYDLKGSEHNMASFSLCVRLPMPLWRNLQSTMPIVVNFDKRHLNFASVSKPFWSKRITVSRGFNLFKCPAALALARAIEASVINNSIYWQFWWQTFGFWKCTQTCLRGDNRGLNRNQSAIVRREK